MKNREFNQYKLFLKVYNHLPKVIRFCVSDILKKIYGEGWYGTFVLKSVLKHIDFLDCKYSIGKEK